MKMDTKRGKGGRKEGRKKSVYSFLNYHSSYLEGIVGLRTTGIG